MRTRPRKKKSDLPLQLLFIAISLALIYPIIFAFSTSFKTLPEVYDNSLGLIPKEPTFAAYEGVISRIPFFRITFNTLIVASIVTLFKLFTGVLAAYSFAFLEYRGKRLVYFILICTIFIPFTVTMIPNFITIVRLGLRDTLLGVALPQLADAIGIFLLHQHMRGIPKSLLEVAELEKAPHFTRLRTIVVPLIKPAISSIGIIFFINSWNEFVWPSLILKSTINYTLPLALQMFASIEGGTNVPSVMATSVMTMLLPLILYAFCQRFIIETFSQSGIKG
jgi:sn-glycerol 3-phosphate transport system permease protein